MFEFSTINHTSMAYCYTRLEMECPYCGHIDSYIHKLALRCIMCDEEIPNATSLMRSVNEKLYYHVMGQTCEVNRCVKQEKT